MGWSFATNPSFTKAHQVAEFRKPSGWSLGTKLLADRVVGNHYWAAVENAQGEKFVFLALMSGGGRQGYGWGYKSMSEYEGPSAVDCPLALLDMTDEPTNGWAKEWRTRVRAFHDAKKARKQCIQPGAFVEYGGIKYRLLEKASPRKGWRVLSMADGYSYRMTARQIAAAKIA